MAKEYIKREDAREKLCSMCRWEGTVNCGECEHPIDDIPSADVAPVVHARWIEDGDNHPMSCDKCYCCSNCHGNRRLGWHLKPFCEDCGADMREVDDED